MLKILKRGCRTISFSTLDYNQSASNRFICECVYLNMKTISWFVIIVCYLNYSCDNEDIAPFLTENPVNLSMPQNGQQSYFVEYTATCGARNVHFTGDTLVLHVLARNDSTFFTESFTGHSPSYLQTATTKSIEYSVAVINNNLIVKDRAASRLFYFYGNDSLRLSPAQTLPMKQENCRVMLNNNLFTGEEIGNINRFSIGNKSFKNKTVVSCVPIFYQIEGYLIYDTNEFSVSHTIVNDTVRGWLKL